MMSIASFALKGQHIPAQGNALGIVPIPIGALKRSSALAKGRHITQGVALGWGMLPFQGARGMWHITQGVALGWGMLPFQGSRGMWHIT
jgi:hypothetical protein